MPSWLKLNGVFRGSLRRFIHSQIFIARHDDITGIIEEGILQLTGKYLATEGSVEGYLVVFDTKMPVGAVREPKTHPAGDKQVLCFTIAIGKP